MFVALPDIFMWHSRGFESHLLFEETSSLPKDTKWLEWYAIGIFVGLPIWYSHFYCTEIKYVPFCSLISELESCLARFCLGLQNAFVPCEHEKNLSFMDWPMEKICFAMAGKRVDLMDANVIFFDL